MSIFKAYDIRGTYPDQIDETTARRVGMAVADHLRARRLVVGRDMRAMSPAITDALCDGIQSRGCEVVDIGLAQTPRVYQVIGTVPCDGGIAVTASHNPARYIGFKMCKAGPVPLSGVDGIPEIQALVEGPEPAPAERRGRREPYEAVDAFVDEVVALAGGPNAIPPQKIVVDYANGMGAHEGPRVFARFEGLEVVPLYDTLDGSFPNHEANPLLEENLEDLRARIAETGATLGLSFDGDADRCAFVDGNGRTVGADLITAILARHLLAAHPGRGVIYDLRSSRVVPETIAELGGIPVKERVGHSFMKATMREKDCIGGGELSGHFYFREFHDSDCGILAGCTVLARLGREGTTLAEAADALRKYSQSGEINFRVEDKEGAMAKVVEALPGGRVDRLDGVMVEFDDWWVNVRPSNTEPYLRLVMEATTPELLAEKRALLVSLLGRPV